MLQDRDYQLECETSVLRHLAEGVRQQLIVMATGTGKTVVFSKLITKLKPMFLGKVLVFAHREELVDQAVDCVRGWNPDLKVGKEMANDWAEPECDVIVSCVASIGRSGSTRLARFGSFDIVICDEAHHSIAETYLNVFEVTGVLKPESKKLLLGFTATPKRKNLTKKEKQQVTTLDEENILSLKSVYKKIVFTYPIRKAIKDGWLVPLRGFRLKTDTDLSDIKTTAGDYKQDELADTVNNPKRNAQIVKGYLDNGESRQFVCFTVDVEHAKTLAQAFQVNGVKAEAIWGDDPERFDRAICSSCFKSTYELAYVNTNCKCRGAYALHKGKITRHKEKEIAGLFNCQVLTEGYDDWRVSCIILAAPTKNASKFTQEVGRGTRLQAGTGNLLVALANGLTLEKRDCLILDVVDNSKRCSLVTFPSLLGLNPEFDLGGQEAVKVAEEIEALQEKNPGVDFSNLVDIANVKAYIESVDLFAEVSDEDVKQHSKFSWIPDQGGSYILSIPEKEEVSKGQLYYAFKHEKLHLKQNELEEWELSITTKDTERKLGTFNTLPEAFITADDVLVRCRPDRLKLLGQKEEWHENPASDAAKTYLARLAKKRLVGKCLCKGYRKPNTICPVCQKITGLTAGEASRAIDKLKHQSKESA